MDRYHFSDTRNSIFQYRKTIWKLRLSDINKKEQNSIFIILDKEDNGASFEKSYYDMQSYAA